MIHVLCSHCTKPSKEFDNILAARTAGWKGMGWGRPGKPGRYWGFCPECQVRERFLPERPQRESK